MAKTGSTPNKRTTASARRPRGSGGTAKPLYAQVDETIRQRLIDNVWEPGDILPSEIQLAAELGVSQGTVRKALNDLVAENLLERRQGRGTFVSEHTERRSLFLYFNLVRRDGDRSMPVSKALACEHRQATPEEAARLQIKPRDEVISMRRVRSLHGKPVIVDRLTVPKALLPTLDADKALPENLYRYYQSEHGINVVKARESVSAIPADGEEARLLEVALATPLLEIDRIAVTLAGRPVEWRVSHCNTDEYVYMAERG